MCQKRSNQRSISPKFYKQLLCTKIPKELKDTDDVAVFFALLGSVSVKADCKTLVKFTPVVKSCYGSNINHVMKSKGE